MRGFRSKTSFRFVASERKTCYRGSVRGPRGCQQNPPPEHEGGTRALSARITTLDRFITRVVHQVCIAHGASSALVTSGRSGRRLWPRRLVETAAALLFIRTRAGLLLAPRGPKTHRKPINEGARDPEPLQSARQPICDHGSARRRSARARDFCSAHDAARARRSRAVPLLQSDRCGERAGVQPAASTSRRSPSTCARRAGAGRHGSKRHALIGRRHLRSLSISYLCAGGVK